MLLLIPDKSLTIKTITNILRNRSIVIYASRPFSLYPSYKRADNSGSFGLVLYMFHVNSPFEVLSQVQVTQNNCPKRYINCHLVSCSTISPDFPANLIESLSVAFAMVL